MQTYLDFLQHILDNGIHKPDRTRTGTMSVFGYQMRFDLAAGFPLVTTKKVHWKSIAHEMLWFLRGETNIRYLRDNGVTIWDEWALEDGEVGPLYGVQWRRWFSYPKYLMDGKCSKDAGRIDQIANVIRSIRCDPHSRRHIVSAWNVADLPNMRLAPCHVLFQFYVADGRLSCMITQRSADAFLGVPFNIASYALLTHMVAVQCGLTVGELVWSGGDCHIYSNHLEQVELQLSRQPMPLPMLVTHRKPENIDGYAFEDFELVGYQHHPAIKAAVAV